MKNGLASVQVITSIRPIDGADKIETATVLGWEVVIKKDEYKVGDKVCYIQIDTVVPEKPEYEFLRSRKHRVRTIVLRQQISQGLIVPLPKGNFKEGDDITNIIGVKKYERKDSNPISYDVPRIPKTWYGKIWHLFLYKYLYKYFPSLEINKSGKSQFPKELVSITDEERIQNMPKVLDIYKGKEFIVSHKLDGSSLTAIHSKRFGVSKYRICSRRLELHGKNNDWHKVFESTQFSKEIDKLVKHYKTNNIIVQGEAIGKFNGNHHNLSKNEIRLFNIFVDSKKITQDEFIDVCVKLYIPHCPLFGKIILNHTLSEILKLSEIPDVLNKDVPAEGLVWRCTDGTLSFKVINNKYLHMESLSMDKQDKEE